MKDFLNWGVKIRRDQERNYYSIWHNLKTFRLDMGPSIELVPEKSEFYDVGINSLCNAACHFCYVSAGNNGKNFTGIIDTWKRFISMFPEDKTATEDGKDEIIKEILEEAVGEEDDSDVIELKIRTAITYKALKKPLIYTEKPFQIAIGSTGEPTVHPDFTGFLETVYESGVVPNYTTNGILLAEGNEEILEATSKYCGGVAVSFGNLEIRDRARKAIENLLRYGDCKVMIHHIISDKNSVDDFIGVANEYKGKVHYHVLLPLMAHGRSKTGMMNNGVYEYLADKIKENKIINVALGANFLPYLKEHPGLINVYDYPNEVYSKNILLKDGKIIITKSSFNLRPIKEL